MSSSALAGRTPSITLVTTSGSVAAGSRKATFIFSTDFTGTLLGVSYSGTTDAAQTLDPPTGEQSEAIAYTVITGSIRIVQFR